MRVDWRGWADDDEASGATLSSDLIFLREGAAVVLSLGSLGLRGFFSLGGFPSSMGFPSGPTSFFLRGRLTFAGGVEVEVEALCAAAFAWCSEVAFVRLRGGAVVAGEGLATPPARRISGFEACGWATRMVSEAKVAFCGDVGGEEMDEEE